MRGYYEGGTLFQEISMQCPRCGNTEICFKRFKCSKCGYAEEVEIDFPF